MRGWTLTACALVTATASIAAPSDPPGPEQPIRLTAEQTDFRALCRQLAGEWEGQVQVRRDGVTSASVASASNRFEHGDAQFASFVEGFAFGGVVELATVVPLSGEQTRVAWADTVAGTPARCVLSPVGTEADGAVVFQGQRQVGRESVTIQQRVLSRSADRYQVEVFTLSPTGEKELLCKLDMHRLPQGQLAAASDMFKFAEPLQHARSLLTATAQVTGQ